MSSSERIPDWNKGEGLIPAIVQHADSGAVLMLGYVDEAALAETRRSGRVTFFSRSKQRLWTKGESSGHWLELVSIALDCDGDTFLVRARPAGPVCHLGTPTCFDAPGATGGGSTTAIAFLAELDALVARRQAERPEGSYTTKLFDGGVRRIAQKVGEEGVETALAAVAQDDAALLGESADLVYHLLVLLRARGLGLAELAGTLQERHQR